jgi:superfamily II DNA/RNA helicase
MICRSHFRKIKPALPERFQTIMTSATLNEDLTELKSLFVVGPVVSLKLKVVIIYYFWVLEVF